MFCAGAATRTSDLIYYDVVDNSTGMCFRRFNATHQIGCSCKQDAMFSWFGACWHSSLHICILTLRVKLCGAIETIIICNQRATKSLMELSQEV